MVDMDSERKPTAATVSNKTILLHRPGDKGLHTKTFVQHGMKQEITWRGLIIDG